MRIAIAAARTLAMDVLTAHRVPADEAEITADHLVDAHLAGHDFAGLPRLLVVLERIRADGGVPEHPIEVVAQTPVSATIDGHHHLGYVVCRRAVDLAVEKARSAGVAVVGAYNPYYSGRSGYYTERAARAGMVALHVSSAFPMVAPTGGIDPVLGSNPLTVAFPHAPDPVAVDLSTAAITWGEIQLARTTGSRLAERVAIDHDGHPTTDAEHALHGAALPWGGHKGYALGLAVQLLSVLAGGDALPEPFGNFGFLFVVFRPDLLAPRTDYERKADELVQRLHRSRPEPGRDGVLVPGERSGGRRARQRADGHLEIPDVVYQQLVTLSGSLDRSAK
jgi:LDH2 family malate/lactate/ureidoglycolate dehydrogenase